jgi:hypothetical protein
MNINDTIHRLNDAIVKALVAAAVPGYVVMFNMRSVC